MIDLSWMAWTLQAAAIGLVASTILVAMTVWQAVAPSGPRRGFLPLVTTPGDRLFIGLLSSAYIHLAWVGFVDASVWWAFGISVAWLLAVLRWG